MKNMLRLIFLTILSAGLLNNAGAQPSRHFRGEQTTRASGGNYTSTSGGSQQRISGSVPIRNFGNNRSEPRVNQTPVSVPSRNTNTYYSSDRAIVSRNGYSRDNYREGGIRNDSYRNSDHYNDSYRNGYHPYDRDRDHYDGYDHYYGNVYGRRTRFMYGPRYTVIPHSFLTIRFGGYPYYYDHGYFYGYYSGYYQPIFPPFGLHISVLPFGYCRIFIGGIPFFYYNGIYYRQYEDSYEVVDAPMGATVTSLPQGARSVIINGEKLYELNGTYYKADRDENGRDVYIVVGKNGVINNTSSVEGSTSAPPAVGDILSQLPEGSKIVTINNEQVYETPDHLYLKEESNNGIIQYRVIGK